VKLILDRESKVQEVHRTCGLIDFPGEFAVVKCLVEGTEFSMAGWSTGPILDTKTIINTPGPIEQMVFEAFTKICLMVCKVQGGIHRSQWCAHCSTGGLVPVHIKELKDIVCHNDLQGINYVTR